MLYIHVFAKILYAMLPLLTGKRNSSLPLSRIQRLTSTVCSRQFCWHRDMLSLIIASNIKQRTCQHCLLSWIHECSNFAKDFKITRESYPTYGGPWVGFMPVNELVPTASLWLVRNHHATSYLILWTNPHFYTVLGLNGVALPLAVTACEVPWTIYLLICATVAFTTFIYL